MSRDDLAEEILSQFFGIKGSHIEPVGRAWNNHVYQVFLKRTVSDSIQSKIAVPGISSIPPGTSRLILRISNRGANLEEEVRVPNEVAAMSLMRSALADRPRRIVPNVYGWQGSGKSADQQGWILEEFLDGELLSDLFDKLDNMSQTKVLRQMAAIFKDIQKFGIPETIMGYGGLNFDAKGDIVAGRTTIPCGGPFSSLKEMYTQLCEIQISCAESSELLQGWKGVGNLRQRLKAFIATGISDIVKEVPQRKTLVHGDLGEHNILVDPASLEVTGLLDFEFSHIASPLDEYFYSFDSFGGLFTSRLEALDDPPRAELIQRQLNGFPSDPTNWLPYRSEDLGDQATSVNWWTAKIWNDELVATGAIKYGNVLQHVDESYADLYWLAQAICPPYLVMKQWLDRSGVEKIQKEVERTKEKIDRGLKLRGY